MTEVIERLYIAGIKEVQREAETKEHEVTHILNVASELACEHTQDEYLYKMNGVHDDDPTEDISLTFDSNLAWIHQALTNGGTVMVHCRSGVSRSAVTVMAYMVRYANMSVVDAYHKVLARRPQVDPWPRYLEQLQQWSITCRDWSKD